MKSSLILLIAAQFAVCMAFGADGASAAFNDYGWKASPDGTRLMHSTDGGKTWSDASPPALIKAAKSVKPDVRLPAHAMVADSAHGNPAFPKGPLELVKIVAAFNDDVVDISVVIKTPAKGKQEVVIPERTTDGGKTWWTWKDEPELPRDYAPKPVMFGASTGWMQKGNDKESLVLHTGDGGKHWIDVSPPALAAAVKNLIADNMADSVDGDSALCPLDARRAWLSIDRVDLRAVLLEYTGDAGRHWKEISAPIATDNADISFPDELHGFLLATSGPAFGHQEKNVYATDDGGVHWRKMSVPTLSTGLSYYTSGISFRTATNGWISGTYHGGPDVPVFYTRDGGRTWALQKLPVPADYIGGYGDADMPVFTGKEKLHGYVPVHLVRHDPPPDHSADVNFETNDGGLTWHLPASGVHSVSEVRDE